MSISDQENKPPGRNYINCFLLGEEKSGKSSYLRWLSNQTYSNNYRQTKKPTSTIIKFNTSRGEIIVKFWDVPSLDMLYDGTEKPDYVFIVSEKKETNCFYGFVQQYFFDNNICCPLLLCQSKIDNREDYAPFMASFSVKKKINCYVPIVMFLREIEQDPFLYLKE
jgi:GTPase SAR1 family protein